MTTDLEDPDSPISQEPLVPGRDGDDESSTNSPGAATSSDRVDDDDLTRFFRVFLKAKGAKAIVCVTLLWAFGIGSTVGVVRAPAYCLV